MRPRGAAAVSVGLWVLVTVHVAADPAVTEPRRCFLSHYRWLDPRALEAVRALRDHYEEETRSWRPWNCSFRPRRGPRLPGSCAGLRRVARGLSDAQAVLSSLPSPELFPGVAPTLELLASARRDVEACVSVPAACLRLRPQPGRRSPLCAAPTRPGTVRVPLGSEGGAGARGPGGGRRSLGSFVDLLCPLQLQLARPGSSRKCPRAPRRRPHRRRGDSPGCHEATIVFNLLRLLAWDLKLAARSAPCL
ncbi:unnamed protein product [Pipistrellus nathusii]|uniref:Interferon lambda-4-like n=1 Tax=Pipistrellus nathusii TaxID=59473 RepID=A0ABN9ZG16_PIPNA